MAVNLTDVDAAITAIQEGGQSVTLDGFTYSAGSLQALTDLRARLQLEEGRTDGSRPLFRRFKLGAASYSSQNNTTPIVRVISG